MPKKTDNLLHDLVDLITKINKSKAIVPIESQEDAIIVACGRYLKSKGYKIVKPGYALSAKPANIKELVDYFCYVQSVYHPSHFLDSNSRKEAYKIMNDLVESRVAEAPTKEIALAEAATIVFTVFDKEEYIGLDFPPDIRSFDVNSKRAWIVQKAVDILNNRNKEASEEEAERIYEKVINEEVKRIEESGASLGWDDLDDLLES